MFSALNILRPVASKTLRCGDVEFSQNYLFFYDKLEKANLFLESVIKLKDRPTTDRYMEFLLKQPVQDGGNWLGFIELVKKYGVVPREVMPETFSSSNSGTVNSVLGMRLRQYALKLRKETKPERIAENAQLFDFELSEADMKALDALDEGARIGPDPDNFNF